METTESEKGAAVPGNSETTIPQKQTQTVETNSSKKRYIYMNSTKSRSAKVNAGNFITSYSTSFIKETRVLPT